MSQNVGSQVFGTTCRTLFEYYFFGLESRYCRLVLNLPYLTACKTHPILAGQIQEKKFLVYLSIYC